MQVDGVKRIVFYGVSDEMEVFLPLGLPFGGALLPLKPLPFDEDWPAREVINRSPVWSQCEAQVTIAELVEDTARIALLSSFLGSS
jgi:hypothetical protein